MTDSSLVDWLGALERVTGRAPRRSGEGWSALCPAHEDRNESLSLAAGTSTPVVATCHAGCTFEAIRDALGLAPAPRNDAERVWDYRLQNGTLAFHVVRRDTAKGKEIRPRLPSGEMKAYPAPRPLYALPDLAERAGDPVLVVEGEKTADAAARLFPGYAVTTSANGSKAARKTDWTPVAGRRVTIWPDADDDGAKYATLVSELCRSSGAAEVRIVALPAGLPNKWDLADAIPEELDPRALVEVAPVAPAAPVDAPEWLGKLVSLGDLLNEPEEQIPFVVDRLLPAGGLSLLLGKPKVGKSTLARCLLVSVARGGAWLGRECIQGPAVYLALEEKRSEVRRHFASLGATGADPIHCYIDRPPEVKSEEFIRAVIASCSPRLVVVDPLAFLTKVTDNSDYAEVVQKLSPIVDVVRDTETHVVLVHHSRKADGHHGDEALGSTGYLGAVDTAVSLRRELDTPTGGIGNRTVYSIGRYGKDLESTVLAMDEYGWVNLGSTVAELGIEECRGRDPRCADYPRGEAAARCHSQGSGDQRTTGTECAGRIDPSRHACPNRGRAAL